LQPKKGIAEFVSSILFAIVVATTVHTYFIQPYTIPTSSLEKSLLIGDFLFVSKFHYGARAPMTTVSFPMVHDTIPVVKSKSYFSKPLLPYFRFPSFENIENNDIVVFNWPTDTVYYFRDPSKRNAYKPIDKKSNYVKRCLGIAGDSLQIKDGDVYINGSKLPMHDRQRVQFTHVLRLKEPSDVSFFENYEISMKEVFRVYQIPRNEWEKPGVPNFINGSNERENSFAFEIEKDSATVTLAGMISNSKIQQLNIINDNKSFYVHMPDDQVAKLRNNPYVASVNRIVKKESDDKSIFPHSKNWTVDNMGPLYIPKAGVTVALNTESLPFYQRIISEYEGHDLKVMGNEIRIDGKIATSYTFAQDYYWMMGDNRHNSEDSRYWGFVPHDHIVGKPVFIWMSIDYDKKKIRWERLFTTVGGSGTPTSYFKLFLIFVALYYGFDYFRKKMKDKKELNS
jgi:signal peptidase I